MTARKESVRPRCRRDDPIVENAERADRPSFEGFSTRVVGFIFDVKGPFTSTIFNAISMRHAILRTKPATPHGFLVA